MRAIHRRAPSLQVQAAWRDGSANPPFGALIAQFSAGKATLVVLWAFVSGGNAYVSLVRTHTCTVLAVVQVLAWDPTATSPPRPSSLMSSSAAFIPPWALEELWVRPRQCRCVDMSSRTAAATLSQLAFFLPGPFILPS